jgi:hypothetical protein
VCFCALISHDRTLQLFNSRHFKRASDDGFFLSMEAQDPKFEMEPCKKLLQSVGALQIEVIE